MGMEQCASTRRAKGAATISRSSTHKRKRYADMGERDDQVRGSTRNKFRERTRRQREYWTWGGPYTSPSRIHAVLLDFCGCGKKYSGVYNDGDFVGVDGQRIGAII
ncbi:hypothetical protein GT037_000502 [Alternaria burnsii]|uniref:Uncharacterized protein n=1 Tax=Alternaria burnsii TaxID=1187904 RepID=A0A8H7BG63_9PLEO|nr:uncharacterized protein GT037_000502 [Alternaria burnsii]KAF7681526.1 hypothetical protein GT037_000502 [Alternaria burnsii]